MGSEMCIRDSSHTAPELCSQTISRRFFYNTHVAYAGKRCSECVALSHPLKENSPALPPFHASLLQAIDVVMPFALCPQAAVARHFTTFETQIKPLAVLTFHASLLGNFISGRHVQGSAVHWSFRRMKEKERWM